MRGGTRLRRGEMRVAKGKGKKSNRGFVQKDKTEEKCQMLWAFLWWKYDHECDFINIQSAPKMKNDERQKETYLFNVTPSSIITGSRCAPEEMKK